MSHCAIKIIPRNLTKYNHNKLKRIPTKKDGEQSSPPNISYLHNSNLITGHLRLHPGALFDVALKDFLGKNVLKLGLDCAL